MTMIEVNQLTKTYMTHERGHSMREIAMNLIRRPMKEVRAVQDITFSVNRGEMVAFLGPNGAGKSTTLKMLTGVLHPTSGEAKVLGLTPWKQRREYVRHIGAVFGQKSQLLWDIPPIDAFYMNKAIYGVPEADYRRRLDQLTTLLQVGDIMKKPTRQLSLGERMKCEFIMAMLHGPQLVFLDEPTIGLDVFAKESIRDFIKDMNKQGVTFILTTHDLDDVELLAERVIVINHGEIVYDNALTNLQRLLGDKKNVRIVTDTPIRQLSLQGVTVVNSISEVEAELEIDTEIIPLKRFINAVNEQCGIQDMAITPLPIETLMKELYGQGSRTMTAASATGVPAGVAAQQGDLSM
ncbi:ABC-2 type transport system ATP-binding protein [Paenibacillus cellulosilyticus]|uniref:ABC-2 type transport system ATP-binding protein n=2 Tax=Paenibacillus cellulosilyticus TaxID=375489 RepID=A0A2V2YEC5_9BACL|nr:ATP-binding cassette domain-containing protein [Paenibacillus cellulosilyticus]PWV90540.1 ABC-2 type transport system ATP-binding protein [Paenibacillus cellulosilyticus]